MIRIEEVVTKRQKRVFVDFPTRLYKNCKNYVPPLRCDELDVLNPRKNPSFGDCKAKFFLAYRGEEKRPVGRIAGIVNYVYNDKVKEKLVRFSRFDSIDDGEVACALFAAVEAFGRQEGMEKIHGPLGFNDTDREGMLVEGFDKVGTFITQYSYDYYPRLVEENGFTKEMDWLEFYIKCPERVDERVLRLSDYIKKRYQLREVADTNTKRVIKRYADGVFDVMNEAYEPLYGVVPITPKVKEAVLKTFRLVINMRYMSIIVDNNDEVVGYGVAFPSLAEALNKCKGRLTPLGLLRVFWALHHPKRLELAHIGIRNKYRNCGLNGLMIAKVVKHAIEDKLVGADTNPELEDNIQVQAQWGLFDAERNKRRRCYIKSL